jgi:hypothetical protein
MNCGQQMQHSEKKSNMSRRSEKAHFNLVLEELREMNVEIMIDNLPAGSFKFIRHSPPLSTQQRGTCVTENLETYRKLEKKGAKMVMGEMRSRMSEWADLDECRGLPIYHVWVEVGDMVYDVSNGNKVIAPRELFYLAKRVVRAEEVQVVKKVRIVRLTKNSGMKEHIWTLDDDQVNAFGKPIREKQRRLGVHFDD